MITKSVAEDGQRVVVDSRVKDRGQTAVWGGEHAGPLGGEGFTHRVGLFGIAAAICVSVAIAYMAFCVHIYGCCISCPITIEPRTIV